MASRRTWILTAVALSLVALVAFAFRPTPILGVDGGSLAYSVDRSLDSEPCRRQGDRWRCDVWVHEMSGAVDYFVEVGSTGCWTAQRRGPEAGVSGAPKRRSGCVTLWDHFRPFDLFS